ncbi:MAG: Gfo/Idh/MocA family oxidoreductase [Anaerolineae bacterium]|nr:Gfo/Idh/MocA family oxidoreductase [Anaerolineae bacterium]
MTTVALVGCGHIHTPGFVKRLQARTDVTVKYVWDHRPERAAANAEALAARPVAEADAIWADEQVAGVIICSETDRHEPLVLAAAAAGKHMFVEKPLGLAAADAYRMAAAVKQAGVLFQTGYFQRGLPFNQFLREQIALGHLGQVTRIRITNCHAGSLKGWFDTEWRWMADPSQAGVGAFGDLGTHALDLLLWMMGEVKEVAASIRPVTGRYGECDETGEGILNFANGAIGTLAAGWVDVAHPVSHVVSGTEGHAYVANGQLFFQSEHVPGADGKTPWEKLPAAWPHAFELFLDALNGKPVPLVTVEEAALRSSVMAALYEAARTRSWVVPE